jgi:hypothetical protein
VDILIAPPDGMNELPPQTLPLLLERLEAIGFLTDHLSLPHVDDQEAVDRSEVTSNSRERDSQREQQTSMARYRASYMGVCRVLHPHSHHRRIDIKIYPKYLYPFAILYFTGSDHFNRYGSFQTDHCCRSAVVLSLKLSLSLTYSHFTWTIVLDRCAFMPRNVVFR